MSGILEGAEKAEKALNMAIESKVKSERAEQRIVGHENICIEKHDRVLKTQDEIKSNLKKLDSKIDSSVNRVYSLLWKSAAGLITVLLTLTGVLAYQVLLK